MKPTNKPPPTIPKAIFYARVSSEGQTDNTSIDTQVERGKAFINSQGWTLDKLFIENGESGKSTDRTSYQEMLSYLQDNPVNVLLVFKLDRLFRNLKDLLIFIDDELTPRDISLVSISENFDTGSPQGRLFLSMIGSFAEFERGQILQRTMSGKVATAKKGGWNGGRVPFGFRKINGSEHDFDVEETEARIVKKIFRLYSKGKGYLKISKAIDGALSPQGISKLIGNPFYIGLVRFNSIIKANNHPSLISVRLFNKCEKVRSSKALAA